MMIDGNILLMVSPLRRIFALGALALLSGLCLYLVFNAPFSFGITVIGSLIALGAFWAFAKMYQGTRLAVELRDDGMYLTDGRCLAAMDQIVRVDRGTFSIKPTNGFTLILRDKAAFEFVPGLYWRSGRKLGLGGVTAPHMGKMMSEALAMRIAERDGIQGKL
ncbi:MAG: hypothetical protein AAF386_13850 [Pseudomonadota bacterium]